MLQRTVYVALALLSLGGLRGETLPILTERPWMGYWIGFETKKWDFGIGAKGKGLMIGKRDGERISSYRHFRVEFMLEEKIDGKWVKREMKPDGFETVQEATEEPEKLEFVATYTDGGQARFGYVFTKRGVQMSAELVQKSPKATDARVGVRTRIPQFFVIKDPSQLEPKNLKQKLRDETIRIVLNNRERLNFGLWEDVFLQSSEIDEVGAQSFRLDTEVNGGLEYEIKLGQPGTGKLIFRQHSDTHRGFWVNWYPEATKPGRPKPFVVYSAS